MRQSKYLAQFAALILAGEAIFLLPFVIPRVFRSTLLEVYNIDNIDLGICFSIYGLVAVFSYIFGGPLADVFSARKLISLALSLTAIGGLFLAVEPSLMSLKLVYGFWGFSTIFLFWAALMKSTRLLVQPENEAKAFGWVEGGRGLSSALWAGLAVALFSLFFQAESVDSATSRNEAYRMVLFAAAGILFLIAAFNYFILPEKEAGTDLRHSFAGFREIISKPGIWFQGGIVFLAYCGYKTTDDISLYAREVWGLEEEAALQLSSNALYLRPLTAILAGWLADRWAVHKVLLISFACSAIGALLLSQSFAASYGALSLIYFGLALSGVYALRGIYIALMRENKVKRAFSGTAVGIISVVGYLPDIFMSPFMGYILESEPGKKGHYQLFLFLSLLMIMGMILSWLWHRKVLSAKPA